MGFNLSSPAALSGLKHLSSLSMPSAAMLMSGIFFFFFGGGGGWTGMVGWPKNRENLAITSGQGTLNLRFFWG